METLLAPSTCTQPLVVAPGKTNTETHSPAETLALGRTRLTILPWRDPDSQDGQSCPQRRSLRLRPVPRPRSRPSRRKHWHRPAHCPEPAPGRRRARPGYRRPRNPSGTRCWQKRLHRNPYRYLLRPTGCRGPPHHGRRWCSHVAWLRRDPRSAPSPVTACADPTERLRAGQTERGAVLMSARWKEPVTGWAPGWSTASGTAKQTWTPRALPSASTLETAWARL